MVFLYMVLMCIAAGVALALLRILFWVVTDKKPRLNDHFKKKKRRYQMAFIYAVIIAAVIYVAYTNSDLNGDVEPYDNRGVTLDD